LLKWHGNCVIGLMVMEQNAFRCYENKWLWWLKQSRRCAYFLFIVAWWKMFELPVPSVMNPTAICFCSNDYRLLPSRTASSLHTTRHSTTWLKQYQCLDGLHRSGEERAFTDISENNIYLSLLNYILTI